MTREEAKEILEQEGKQEGDYTYLLGGIKAILASDKVYFSLGGDVIAQRDLEGIECARELLPFIPKYRLELLLDIFKDVPFEDSLAEIVNLGKVLVGKELTKKWKEVL